MRKAKTNQSTALQVLSAGQIGKLPPQATELEEAVLGALLLERDALDEVIDILVPGHFYKPAHQVVYEAVCDLFNDAAPIDILTVTERLRKSGQIELAGGPYAITQLTKGVSSSANIQYHARIIVKKAIKRETIRIGSMMLQDGYDDTVDAFQLVDASESALFEVVHATTRKRAVGMKESMTEAFDDLRKKKDQEMTGTASGFTALDRVTGGWQRSDLIIIAARPAMGKTAFVVSALRNAAVDHGHAVAIFSLEMSRLQLTNRLISGEAEIESEKIKNGSMAEHEWAQLVHKTARLTKAPIFIDDTPALSVLELRAKCRRLKKQHDIQLVVIDYLQLMSGDISGQHGNREQEIAQISRSLKNLAKELNVPVLALSQLSRAVETRGGDKRPQLSDLRESGSIEQDADLVMFLYRPEYYGLTQDENGMPTTGIGEVIIGKHRNGSLENIQLKFIGKYTKFTNLEAAGAFGYGSEAVSTLPSAQETVAAFEAEKHPSPYGHSPQGETTLPLEDPDAPF